jgi:hypothetical protein
LSIITSQLTAPNIIRELAGIATEVPPQVHDDFLSYDIFLEAINYSEPKCPPF